MEETLHDRGNNMKCVQKRECSKIIVLKEVTYSSFIMI